MSNLDKIRIGTRGSKLALVQASMVKDMLFEAHPELVTEIVTIKTSGDKILEQNLSEIGGKGLFIKEIEEKLLDGSIDIAVHSMKDMPAFIHDKLRISCILPREDPRDVLVSNKAATIADLPEGAMVGTSSPRRAAQALNIRSDLKIVPFRGNIHTRLKKIEENEVDATFLALAGLKRSGISGDFISPIDSNIMLSAVAQGAIGIEIAKEREELDVILSSMHHENTAICVDAERVFLEELDGSCRTPIAALAIINGDEIILECLVARMDGSEIIKTSRKGVVSQAKYLGKDAAEELLTKAGEGFFDNPLTSIV